MHTPLSKSKVRMRSSPTGDDPPSSTGSTPCSSRSSSPSNSPATLSTSKKWPLALSKDEESSELGANATTQTPSTPPSSPGAWKRNRADRALEVRLSSGSMMMRMLCFAVVAVLSCAATLFVHHQAHCLRFQAMPAVQLDASSTTSVMRKAEDVEKVEKHLEGKSEVSIPRLVYRASDNVEDPPVADNSTLRTSPRIAWLMSFPNSGTSFTMSMVQRMSGFTAASNYQAECRKLADPRGDPIVPLFQNSETPAPIPCVLSPIRRPMPSDYILTKTHCGGYTASGGPEKYIETARSFTHSCRSGSFWLEGKQRRIAYPPEVVVARAVHLLRHPLDNIVSRFHHERHLKFKANKTDFVNDYADTPEGFHRWCEEYMDPRHEQETRQSRFIPEEVRRMWEEVPCHEEFFRFVQWHNLAIETSRLAKLPTHALYYEDYTTRYESAVSELLDFLHLKQSSTSNTTVGFKSGKTYRSTYYTPEQRQTIMRFIKFLATPEAWELLKRYSTEDEDYSVV